MKIKKVPLPFAIFYEIILIILAISFPPLWIYAIINGIPLLTTFGVAIGKYEYENREGYEKYFAPEKTKAERELNKLFYKNHKIRLNYYYYGSTEKNKLLANEYFYLDICQSIYDKRNIIKYISNKIKTNKNIFLIYQEFSGNYEYPPENLIQLINITDNEIRFLTSICKLYNIQIFDMDYNYKENITKGKDDKTYWLNYLLFLKISLNKHLHRLIKATAIDEKTRSIAYDFIYTLEENIQMALTNCLIYFPELNKEQIEKIKQLNT